MSPSRARIPFDTVAALLAHRFAAGYSRLASTAKGARRYGFPASEVCAVEGESPPGHDRPQEAGNEARARLDSVPRVLLGVALGGLALIALAGVASIST